LGTDDASVGEANGEHAVDEVGEGADAIHEDPEAREGGGSGEDTGREGLVWGMRRNGGDVYPQKIRVSEKRS